MTQSLTADSPPTAANLPAASPTALTALPEVVPLALVDQGYALHENSVEYGFLVHNPNPAHAIQSSVFSATFLDANNGVIGTDTGTIELLLPDQTTGIGGGHMFDLGENITSMVIEITSGQAVVMTESLPEFEVSNASVCSEGEYYYARAEIVSPYATNVILPRFSVVYYDAQGKIIGSGYGYRSGILANAKTGVMIYGHNAMDWASYTVYAGLRDIPSLIPSMPEDANPLQITAYTYVQTENTLNYSLVIENPNSAYLVDESMLQVSVYAADGTFVSGEPLQITSVVPNQKLGVSRDLYVCPSDMVDHIEVTVSSGEFIQSNQEPYFGVENIAYQAGNGTAIVTGEMVNLAGKDIHVYTATAILYDASDQIIGGGYQNIEIIPAGGRVSVKISAAVNGIPARAELFGVLTRKSFKE